LIAWLATATGLSASDIGSRLLSAHLSELWELRTFLEAHPIGSERHERGKNLLTSFGPESILSGIRRIAPEYVTLEAQFLRSLNASARRLRGGQ
jgi:hypothetical protein